MNARRSRGFTLMETLVMLVLVSFSVLLMFQMLGSYRIARERVIAQSGGIDRQALFDAWFRASVQGLRAVPDVPFAGAADRISGLTLNPLFAPRGAPARFGWMIEPAEGGWQVAYVEDGTPRFKLPFAGVQAPKFAYYDAAGQSFDQWPPPLGEQHALPAAIAIVREGDRTLLASIRGDLDPYYAPYELWEDE